MDYIFYGFVGCGAAFCNPVLNFGWDSNRRVISERIGCLELSKAALASFFNVMCVYLFGFGEASINFSLKGIVLSGLYRKLNYMLAVLRP